MVADKTTSHSLLRYIQLRQSLSRTRGKIAALVDESFSLKKQSEQLLETAKRAVEITIEQNEEIAIKYLNQ
jgi:hypothetical protein